MLQIFIDHCGDKGKETIISGIKDGNNVLAMFDKEKGKVNLDVCIPYIGQDVVVKHRYPDEVDRYQSIATLDGVCLDNDTKLKYIKYTPKQRMPLVED